MRTASFNPSAARAFSVGLLFLLGYLYLSFPEQHPAKLLGFFPDTLVSVWSIWHFSAEPSVYSTRLAFAPFGSSLLLHNITELLSLPFSLLLNFLSPVSTYNVLVSTVLIFNYFAGLYLVGKASSKPAVITGGALLLTLHPFVLGHVAGGHVNLFATFPLYLTIGFALTARVNPLKVAFGLLAVTLTDYYQLWVAGLSLLAVFLSSRNYQVLFGLAVGAALSLAKLFPAALLILSGEYTPNHDPALHSLPYSAVFTPHPLQVIGSSSNYALNWAETGAYLGGGIAVLTLISLFKFKLRFVLPGIIFLLLAFGPFGPLAPYKLVSATTLAPPVPARFFLGTLVFLTLSSALVVSELKPRRLTWVVAGLLFFEFLPKLLPTIAVPESPRLIAITDSKDHGPPKMQLLLDMTSPEQAMFNQTRHHLPILNGFLARRPLVAERTIRQARRAIEKFCAAPSSEAHSQMRSALATFGITGALVSDSGQSITAECTKSLVVYVKDSPK